MSRPHPAWLSGRQQRTVLCTTLGQLCDYWALHGSDIEAKKLLENEITKTREDYREAFGAFIQRGRSSALQRMPAPSFASEEALIRRPRR